MISINECSHNDSKPVCPHCNIELNSINMMEIKAFFGKRYIYYCSQCKKVLGISHRKGFFMG